MRIKRIQLQLRSKNQKPSTKQITSAHTPAQPHKADKLRRRHTPVRRNITRRLIRRTPQNRQTRLPARAPHTPATNRLTRQRTAANTAKNRPGNLLWVIKKSHSRRTKLRTRPTDRATRPLHRTPRAASPRSSPSNQRKNSSVSLEEVATPRPQLRPTTPPPRHSRRTAHNPEPNTAANSASFRSAAWTKSAKTA